MALDLKIEKSTIGIDCKTLAAADNTGIYSASNQGGYRGELQVTNSTVLNTATMVISFTVDAVTYTVTRGVEYSVTAGDNEATAIAIAAAIAAKTIKIGSVAVLDKVYIFPKSTYVLQNISITNETHGLVISQQYRDKQALKVFCLLMRSTGRETKDVPAYIPNGTSPGASWTIAITEDAWYEFFSVLVPVYVSGKTYVQDNIVYLTDTYYKVKVGSTTNTPTNTTDWDVCTQIDQFEIGTNIITSVNDNIIICWSNQCLAKANALYAATGGIKISDEKLSYERIRNYVEGAGYNGDLEQFTQAELLLERVAEYCANINCSCGG